MFDPVRGSRLGEVGESASRAVTRKFCNEEGHCWCRGRQGCQGDEWRLLVRLFPRSSDDERAETNSPDSCLVEAFVSPLAGEAWLYAMGCHVVLWAECRRRRP